MKAKEILNFKFLSKLNPLQSFIALALGLVIYYFFAFGLESPFVNLYGDYSRRIIRTSFATIRQNVPLLPDKLITLLGLGSALIHILLIWLNSQHIPANPLTRILWLVSVIALLPLGLYLLTYASVLVFIGLIFFVLWLILHWILGLK